MVTQFFARFGVARSLHTDQGRNFESRLFKEVCGLLGIEKTRTTAYRPQSDGLVKRANRTIECMLSLFTSRNQEDWDTWLPILLMAYRSIVQNSTGYTPNMLMLVKEVDLPIDLIIGRPPNDERSYTEYVEALWESMEVAHEYTRDSLMASHNTRKGCMIDK